MKLQISFDMTDLDQALDVASKVQDFADIFEIGSPLIYTQGVKAIESFRAKFPQKKIFADAKLVDRFNGVLKIYSQAGANCLSVLAGTSNSAIQKASQLAHSFDLEIALDLVDAYSMGESAMDAKALDIDVIIFHGPRESTRLLELLEEWESVRGNTALPIFIAGGIDRDNIDKVLALKPDGIIIGSAVVGAKDPAKEAEYFRSLL